MVLAISTGVGFTFSLMGGIPSLYPLVESTSHIFMEGVGEESTGGLFHDFMVFTTSLMPGRNRLSCAQHSCINFHASSFRGGLSSRRGRSPRVTALIIGRAPRSSKGLAP